MNKIILMGRLTGAPELKATSGGKHFCKFNLAVARKYKKDETDFINCTAWEKTAEFTCNYFTKGNMIGCVGNLQIEKWQDSDGKNRYVPNVMVEEVYFTGSRQEAINDTYAKAKNDTNDSDFEPAEYDDLPF